MNTFFFMWNTPVPNQVHWQCMSHSMLTQMFIDDNTHMKLSGMYREVGTQYWCKTWKM